MTAYELLDLSISVGSLIVSMLSVYIALSSAAIVGAYVAGRRLTRVLTWGIVLLYSGVALSLANARYVAGTRMENIAHDLAELAAQSGTTQRTIQNFNDSALGHETAMVFYLAIWAAVIFFVFYARSRIAD